MCAPSTGVDLTVKGNKVEMAPRRPAASCAAGSEGLRRFRRSVFLCEPCLKQVWEQDLDRLPPLPEDAGLWEG